MEVGRKPADFPKLQAVTRAESRTGPTVTLPLEEHVGTVYRYALRLARRPDEAEDLTQETMLRAWRGRNKLAEPRAARVWLLRITQNVWNDRLRRAKHGPRLLDSEPPCPRRSPTLASDDRENVLRALAAIDELPPRQRQVMYLIACEQLSHAEVADVLHISTVAVKSNLSLARKEMRRRLKDVYDDVCGRRMCEDR